MTILQNYSINHRYREVLLDKFSKVGTIKDYKKGTFIEYEQQKTGAVYLILDGVVKQFFIGKDGDIKVLLILSKGDMFGEVTIFQNDYDHVNTKTFSQATICKISKDKFYETLRSDPSLYETLLLMVTTKFRTLMYQIYDSTYLNAEERLYSLLKRLSIQHGIKNDIGKEIVLPFTHEEFANIIGSTRSTVSRLLKTLESDGKITRIGKRIIIH